MKEKEEEKFAFPLLETNYFQTGMTLRDYFAGQALVGLITPEELEWCPIDEYAEGTAKLAYLLADAMLKETKNV